MPWSRLVIILALTAVLGPASALARDASCTPEQVDRVTVEARGELMAICCWKNTLLNHSSPRADQMSAEVRRMAEACYSTQEILDEFVKTYGESVLARPRASGGGLTFYLIPAGVLLATGLWLWRRKLPAMTRAKAAPPPAPGGASAELDAAFEAELERHRA